jgi:XTP/dITP diphosphohydrolase
MKIVLATGNKGKVKEFKYLMPNDDVVAYTDIISEFDIIEDEKTFQENAIIKVKAVEEKIRKVLNEPYIIISDDSGITVPALNNEPNIYSARYAGKDATDKDNLNKLISRLKEENQERTKAFYTASIAIYYNDNIYTVHGWMHGDVIDKSIGENGFGYDPIFIPNGYDKTLGELNNEIKKSFSHRSKALSLAKKVILIVT